MKLEGEHIEGIPRAPSSHFWPIPTQITAVIIVDNYL